MGELWGLAALSFVSAITPGPNNVMLWASGVQFGMRRTRSHLGGMAAGMATMVVGVGVGFGVVVATVPAVEIILKVVGSVYLLYLAYRIAGGGAVVRGVLPKPLSFTQALAFQYVNPKAWVFVLAAVTTFRPPDLSVVPGSLLMAIIMITVAVPCATVWAVAGSVLSRFLVDEKRSGKFQLLLGILLAVTVVYIWL